MSAQNKIFYTKDHEWIAIVGENTATVGITKYAAECLGTVVYVELPKIGAKLESGKDCAVVESSKSASDIYAPTSGIVTEINNTLSTTPEIINDDASTAWFFKMTVSNFDSIKTLMNEESYNEFVKSCH